MLDKNFHKKEFFKNLYPLLIVVVIFVLVSYFTQQNMELIKNLISEGGVFSIFVYILITIIAIIAAPLTSVPLIPLVVQSWGVVLTSIFSIIGWTIGSLGAFWISRRYGVSVVSKIESIGKLRTITSGFPEKKMFWYLMFLRMTIPVDILSYALGLFTNISWKMFSVTTFLGVIPITFVFSYVGTLPVKLQLPLIAFGFILIVSFFVFHIRKGRRKTNDS